jgi:endoglucanase
VRGAGQVGTITVSGLPGPDDHQLVVDALKAYLKADPAL